MVKGWTYDWTQRSGNFVQGLRRIIDPQNMSKILDVSVISNVSVQHQIKDIRSVQDFGWIRDLQNLFYAPFENNIWRMVEFTVKIGIVNQDIRRIVLSHIRSSILDWSMISNFQVSRSVQWSLTSFQELRQFSGRDLSDLLRILFRSLIWIVLDFTGEICCVLWDIPRLIYWQFRPGPLSDNGLPYYVKDIGQTVGLKFFRIHDQINDLQGHFKDLVVSEIWNISPKTCWVTEAGDCLNLRVKAEVWRLRPGPLLVNRSSK